MKGCLVASNSERLRRIASGEQIVVGVNRWTETGPSPLAAAGDTVEVIDPGIEAEQIARLEAWRRARDGAAVAKTLAELQRAAGEGRNIMEPSIACAKAGVTTGEWGQTLRQVFGEYRAPTGIGRAVTTADANPEDVRGEVDRVSQQLGRRIKLLVGKPGRDGPSNGAEQIAVQGRARHAQAVIEGIRRAPQQIVRAAIDEAVHVIGLSVLSGSHVPLVAVVMQRLRTEGCDDVPVVVGGIIPADDAVTLKSFGVAAVYTPKHFQLNAIMRDIVRLLDSPAKAA